VDLDPAQRAIGNAPGRPRAKIVRDHIRRTIQPFEAPPPNPTCSNG
jgi:hypothetical protein